MPAIRERAQEAGRKWLEIRKKSLKSRSSVENKILEVLQDEQAAKALEFVSRLNAIAPEIPPVELRALLLPLWSCY